jgi:HK97 family phage prohead protease
VSKHQLVLVRAFPTDLERTGPRTLTGRLVPYNHPTDVVDILPDGEIDVYTEGFRPGAFATQANSQEKGVVNRIGLVHRHDDGLGFLGPFASLREDDDGLYGDASILRSRADDVEDLLANGIDELSIEFRIPQATTEIGSDGIRWRTKAHLDQVALEPKGAYSQAQVLAYRAALDAESADQQATAAAEAERAEAARRAEAEVEAAAARRARWEQLAGRLDGDQARQADLVHRYGITQRGGYGTV